MSIRINLNLFPKDGYFFKEQDGTNLRGKNWTDVIQKVTNYRLRLNLDTSNVQQEVMTQACSRSPAYCYEQTKTQIQSRVSVKAKALKWLSGILKLPKDERDYVAADEAKTRAGICAACPHNASLGVSSCSSCKQAFTTYRKEILGGARNHDSRLGGCSILGIDLITAAHLDEVRIDAADLPAHCWKKKTI